MIPYSMNPMGINPVAELSDLDILRQIRDANPTSQLPSLWLDSENPVTQWEGVTWFGDKVGGLNINGFNVSVLPNISKLTSMVVLDCGSNKISDLNLTGLKALESLYCNENALVNLDLTGLSNLITVDCNTNQLTSLNVTGLSAIVNIICNNNQLLSIPSLTSKGLITYYDFRYNNFPTSELDRLRALGFTDESKLLPQNP